MKAGGTMKLSALDLGPPDQSFRLAPELEAAGYKRHWLAEHQPQPQPLLLVALVAGTTESIRVGTAGVLFHYYPPSRVAMDVRFLESCFPDRIDAGICAGQIGDPDVERDQLDGRERAAHYARYPERVATFVERARAGGGAPQLWSLGTGAKSAHLAARYSLRFGYSLFHVTSIDDTAVVESYRAAFMPTVERTQPYVAVAVAGVCATTDAAAQEIASRHKNPFCRLSVVGSPKTCRDLLANVAERYRADEIVVADGCDRFGDRVASYRLLAEACG